MPFDGDNIQPFLDSLSKVSNGEQSLGNDVNSELLVDTNDSITSFKIKNEDDINDLNEIDDSDGTITSKNSKKLKRNSTSKIELVEKDGKTVSTTSTGKRKFHNKSKFGCDTCKKRRVKCDEGKPICNKCKNMGIDCSYSIPSRKTKNSKDYTNGSDNAILSRISPPHSTTSSSNTDPNLSKLENRHNDLSIPTFTVKSPQPVLVESSSSINNDGLHNDPTFSIASRDHYDTSPMMSRDSLDARNNNLSINLGSMTNNPTISPQPSMSPGSITSQLSGGHSHHHSHHRHHNHHHQHLSDHGRHTLDQDHDQSNQFNISSNISPYGSSGPTSLNLIDLRLMYNYTTAVAPTITTAGISEEKIWSEEIPRLAFNYPFLMHSILAFSATHLSKEIKSLENSVTHHRGEALRLLREAVLEISSDNTDALVASALILIMDSLANASLPSTTSLTSLPASAWIFHVKGAATILTAVWPLPPTSRFYKFISVDLSDLGDIINEKNGSISELVCFDESIADLYPVEYDSPYLITLAYLDKLHHEKFKSDFILRIFAFPALLDKTFLALLMSGDLSAMRIMRSYYSLLRGFTTEMKDKVWFLEGVSKVLPADVDNYSGGGGMHMMLDFLGGGLPSMTTTNLAPGLNIDINDHFMNP